MKTISFHEFQIGRRASGVLLELDTASTGIELRPGLNLIVAPNGRGKTTLLQTLAGTLPNLKGFAKGDEGKPLDPSRDIAYVSEYLTFPKFIYPAEWIEFASQTEWKQARVQVAPWITEFQLDAKMESYLGRMSQGERRKVTWLATHASRKPLALLDEPLDGLDLFGIQAARKLLQNWREEGRILCVVAHQVGELLDLCDQMFLIRDRRLVTWREEMSVPLLGIAPDAFRDRLLEFYRKHPAPELKAVKENLRGSTWT